MPPCASMRRSAAIVTCWPIWCAGCSKTARTRRSSSVAADPSVPIADDPQTAAELDRRTRSTPAIRKFRCRAISTRRRGGIRRASSSATARALPRLLAEVRGALLPTQAAPLVDGIALPGIARAVRSPIDGEAIGEVREGDDTIAAAAMTAAAAGFPAWSATSIETRAAALERASDLLEARRGRLIGASAVRGRQDARRCGGRGARGGRFLPLLRGRGAPHAHARSRCRGRPARSTSFAIAAAACSSASARGIFRSRSSSAR